MISYPALLIVCFFTFLINVTETAAYSMRYAGLKTRQISIAMAFVTSTLLISRLSNMFQAPLLGKMVDETIHVGTIGALQNLEAAFRAVIFSGFIGVLVAGFLTPSFIRIFQLAIQNFLHIGSIPRMFFKTIFSRRRLGMIIRCFTLPKLSMLNNVSIKTLPKKLFILNGLVGSIYAIGVLSALLAGAYLPHLRATAIQLSGIVNGMATIMFTLMVDPVGARITDQAVHQTRPPEDVKSVVFFLIISRLIGLLIVTQLIFLPAVKYIIWITRLI